MGLWQKFYVAGTRLRRRSPWLATRMMFAAAKHMSEPEVNVLPGMADRNKISLDIGANWGMYVAALLPVSKAVIAFEPDPGEADLLRRAYPAAKVEECALGATPGTATLRQPLLPNGRASKGWGTLSDRHFENETTVDVPVKRLDDMGLTDIGLIKIDVEGFEMQVLEGGWETIARDRPVMMIECEHPHAIAERLAPLGYTASFWYQGRIRPLAEWSTDQVAWYGGPPNNFLFRVAD